MSITSFLFRLARLSADTKAVASGDQKRIDNLLWGEATAILWSGPVLPGTPMSRLACPAGAGDRP